MRFRSGLVLVAVLVAFGNLRAEDVPEQVAFEMRIATVSKTLFDKLKEDHGLHEKKPVMTDDKGLFDLLVAVQEDRDSNLMQAPKIVTLLGQPGTVQIGEQRLLVTGARVALRNGKAIIEPETTPVETGLHLSLTGSAPGGDAARANSIDLDLRLISTKLGKVEQVPVKVAQFTQLLENAEVLRNTVERKMHLPYGKTAVMVGWWEEAKGQKEPQRVIVCVTAQSVK